LDFLGKLMGRSFLPVHMERKGEGSVAFEGIMTIRVAFHPDVAHVPVSAGKGG
jgi:hypothetical protein